MKISKYCFSIILLLLGLFNDLEAQEEGEQVQRIKALRLGYDISRLALYYVEPERTAFEVSLDYEIKRKFYLVAEYGMQKYRYTDSLYNYNSEGFYYRLGMDYNTIKTRAENQYEMVFGGLRYGFSKLNQSAENILIRGNYWGDDVFTEFDNSMHKAHWIEAVAGVRAEVFKNFFIGWSFRWRIMIYQTRNSQMEPIYIPGYGKGDKKSVIGFNYYVYYQIPLGKFPVE